MRRSAILASLSLAGCALLSPIPDVRTPQDRAREVEPKCKGLSEESFAPLLAPSAIDSVEPAVSHVLGGPNGREARLRGARIHVRPLPGLTRESLARSVECHEARVLLGSARAVANDPYVLADQWLAIDVDSGGDGFVVAVTTDDRDSAERVLMQARAFARGAAQPAPPSTGPASPPSSPASAPASPPASAPASPPSSPAASGAPASG